MLEEIKKLITSENYKENIPKVTKIIKDNKLSINEIIFDLTYDNDENLYKYQEFFLLVADNIIGEYYESLYYD